MQDGMRAALLVAGIAACTGEIDETPALTVEPSAIELVVDPAIAPQPITVHAALGERDVTADIALAFDGTDLGPLAGATFTSDGRTGGSAMLAITADGQTVHIPITIDIRSARIAPGAALNARDLFANAPRAETTRALEPGDGAVLPANLGGLDIDFAADPTDDLHEVAITAPHLDIRVYAPGAAGPRHIELTPAEWRAIAATARGAGVELAVTSLATAAPTAASVSRAHLGIADLDAMSLWISAAQGGVPSLWRYDFDAGRASLFASASDGTCIGCHVAVSPDGTRVIAAHALPGTQTLVPAIIDTSQHAIVASPPAATTWGSAVFDPSGLLVTAQLGALTLRDGNTFEPLATLDPTVLATTPAISADGHTLVVTALDTPVANVAGPSIRAAAWDAATHSIGPPHELAHAAPNEDLLEPDISLDATLVAFARIPNPATSGSYLHGQIDIVPLAGGFPIPLISDATMPRFASALSSATTDSTTERMTWLIITSARPIADRTPPWGQLWLAAYFPDRNTLSRPFHLPGQPADLRVIHAAGRVR
jgi:hypothetical protein